MNLSFDDALQSLSVAAPGSLAVEVRLTVHGQEALAGLRAWSSRI
jgi:hypothetical protein